MLLFFIIYFLNSLMSLPSIESVILDESRHIQGIPRTDLGEFGLFLSML